MVDPCNILYHKDDQELAIKFLLDNEFFTRRIAMLFGNTCITRELLYKLFKTKVIDLANYIIVERECSLKYINDICKYLHVKGYNFYTCSIVPDNVFPLDFFKIPLYMRNIDFNKLQSDPANFKSMSNPLNSMIHTNIVIELPKDLSIFNMISIQYRKYIKRYPHISNTNMIIENISILPHDDFGLIFNLKDIIFKYL